MRAAQERFSGKRTKEALEDQRVEDPEEKEVFEEPRELERESPRKEVAQVEDKKVEEREGSSTTKPIEDDRQKFEDDKPKETPKKSSNLLWHLPRQRSRVEPQGKEKAVNKDRDWRHDQKSSWVGVERGWVEEIQPCPAQLHSQ